MFAPVAGSACGAVLETLGSAASDALAHGRWRDAVSTMSAQLGWPRHEPVVRLHATGALLALRAPVDQLMLATDVNEWAWELAVGLIGDAPAAYEDYEPLHRDATLEDFQARASLQRNPALTALQAACGEHGLPLLLDDDTISIGTGSGSQCWPLAALPPPQAVPWHSLHSVPTVLVTGSNGKTTSVRLLAAMAKQAGMVPGYCCTDGVFVDGAARETGDYSGPAGARTVLRDRQVGCAVLETARGGILRRGLATDMAQAALVTNVAEDHFGEYGIDSIADLADAKLVVAHALGSSGTLVLNADDAVLVARARCGLPCKLAYFAQDYAHAQRTAAGQPCCGVVQGELLLFDGSAEHRLGQVAAMPLTVGGSAAYNVANAAGAALAAQALGIAPAHIATVLASFGATRHDNPGRLERWQLPGLAVLMDYAHNPDGLHGLLTVARQLRQGGRIGLLLGQAGNRGNDAIAELALAAAAFAPDYVVLKDIGSFMRGRGPGEVPALLRASLLAGGMADERIDTVLSEVDAVVALLAWARAGDVLVLPVHDMAAKTRVQLILDDLQAALWQPGSPLPQGVFA